MRCVRRNVTYEISILKRKRRNRLCLEERQNGFIIVTLQDSKDVNAQTVKFHMVV